MPKSNEFAKKVNSLQKPLSSHLNHELNQLGLKDTDISVLTGLSRAVISRVRSGRQRPSKRLYLKLSLVSTDPKVKARLLVAALLDAIRNLPGSEYINVSFVEDVTRPRPGQWAQKYPPHVQEAIIVLAQECATSPAWVRMSVAFADYLIEKRKEFQRLQDLVATKQTHEPPSCK